MTILALGASHKTAATELLERLAVLPDELPEALHRLRGSTAVDEVMVLSTCNRIEVLAVATGPVQQAAHAIDHFLAARAGLSITEICGFLRVRYEAEAVTHLCAVACGLDSMAIGEEHIVAQLRTALSAAQSAGAAGRGLMSVVDTAVRASKRARNETRIGMAAPSLLSAGLELGRGVLGGLTGRRALLLGSGTIGTLAADALAGENVDEIKVASRTAANAERLAQRIDGTVVPQEKLTEAMADCDILVCSTGAPEPVVTADVLRAARRASGAHPLFCLDLAMPRDIDPACRDVLGVTLVDLDVLGSFLAGRGEPSELDAAWRIVAEETGKYVERTRAAAVTPVITALRSWATSVMSDELDRLRARLPELGEHERTETETAMHRLVGKFLHKPTVRVRELSTATDGGLYVEALSQLFELETHEGSRA